MGYLVSGQGWLLGWRRALVRADKQTSLQGQLLHSCPSPSFEAWCVSKLSIAVTVCEGKGFYCVKGMKLRALLLALFLVHYKPVIPDPGSQDKTGLCLTGTGVYGGGFL